MRGRMMALPLTVNEIMRYAARHHGDVEVVSVTSDTGVHRSSYAEIFSRAGRLAGALEDFGLEHGDRVATLAWNDYRHLELYYGVSCAGYVLHTVNPRLFVDQLVYIINHAEDRILFFDIGFLPLVEKIADELETLEHYVALGDSKLLDRSSLPSLHRYEPLLADRSAGYDWPEVDENSASVLCYTSGTTGNPKGVLYSHRSTVLHTYASVMPDAMALAKRDVVLPVVPMFHVNAWGMPYACPIVGAKLVLPGPKMADAEALQQLVENEGVTVALGVPTVWLTLLKYLRESGKSVASLERTIVGGSACPLSIMREFEERHGVDTRHAWGMTETSPLGAVNAAIADTADLQRSDRDRVRVKQGRVPFGVDLKIVDEGGRELRWDGQSAGNLLVRGFWVCDGYFRDEESSTAGSGSAWFPTGDVATIDARGFLHITDRTKDVIKSGGEWISSIELENLALGHPDVAEAAVIAIADEKWGERPLLVIVPRAGVTIDKQGLLAWFEGKVASWWIPDDVVAVDSIPYTATGKVSKLTLREQLKNYRSSAEH